MDFTYSAEEVVRLQNNRDGYLRSIGTDAEIVALKTEIAHLKNELERQAHYFNGELTRQRAERDAALADRDVHRRYMQALSSGMLWRMSWPLRALVRLYRRVRGSRGQDG